MNLLSWNIQAAKGVDGHTSIERIANVIQRMGFSEVICCQEVLQEFSADGAVVVDQAAELAKYFPEHTLYFGAAVDRLIDGRKVRFGNLALSSLPVVSIAHHCLPQPAQEGSASMVRQAIDLVVDANIPSAESADETSDANSRLVRILSTHLEYYADSQRLAQVRYLHSVCKEASDRFNFPAKKGGKGVYSAAPETLETVLCGDLNLTVGSNEYEELNASEPEQVLQDAWTVLYPNEPHAPTCGVFDHVQWKDGSHCRDFFFITPALAPKIERLTVNVATDASDHQPLRLSL